MIKNRNKFVQTHSIDCSARLRCNLYRKSHFFSLMDARICKNNLEMFLLEGKTLETLNFLSFYWLTDAVCLFIGYIHINNSVFQAPTFTLIELFLMLFI